MFDLKKGLAASLASLIMVLNTVTVSASDINEEYDMCVSTYSDDSQDSEMYLISETQTVLEDGVIETTRLYSSVNPKLRAASGSGTFKNEKELEFSNEGSTPLKYWVQGDFTWNSSKDTAVVSNVKYKHGTIPPHLFQIICSFFYPILSILPLYLSDAR